MSHLGEHELREQIAALQQRVSELESALARVTPGEAGLRESEQLYRNLAQTSPEAIVLTALDGRILMANPQAATLHGYAAAEQMLGENILNMVAPEDHDLAKANLERVTREGRVREVRYLLLRRDGSRALAQVTGSLITDQQGRPASVLINGRDLTEQDRLQRELLQSQKLESIGTLAGGIAHDFNNMLAVVLGNASLALRKPGLPPKVQEALTDIVEAAERASALTRQLLAYARGGLRKPVPTDMNRVVKSVCDMLRRTAPPQIELVVQPAAGLPAVMADPNQMEQAVMNLCLNAIQASTPPASVELRTGVQTLGPAEAKALHLPLGPHVVLKVVDHGCGMTPETAERIFEPFFTTRAEGRGMGLPATLGIIQGHNGQIRVASTPGQGTEMVVWLPVAPSGQKAAEGRGESPLANLPQGNETVLIIDDEPAVAQTMQQMLASLGYCVVVHTDADAAMAFAINNHEDLNAVILNLNMPKRLASDMLATIVGCCPNVPVLLSSGLIQQETVQPLLAAGAAGVLHKPFTIQSLAHAVRQVLDKAQPPSSDDDLA